MITAPFTRLPRKKYDQNKDKVIRIDIESLKESQTKKKEEKKEINEEEEERLSDSSDSDSDASSSSIISPSSPANSFSVSSSSYSLPTNQESENFRTTLTTIPNMTFNEDDEDENEGEGENQSENDRMSSMSGNSIKTIKKENQTIGKKFKNFLRRRKLYVLLQLWRKRKAEERRNPMLLHLENKTIECKEQYYQTIRKEIEEDEEYIISFFLLLFFSLLFFRAVRKHAKKLSEIQLTIARRVS